MSFSKFTDSIVKPIKRVEFVILTNEKIKDISAVKNEPYGIDIAESYDNYEPKKGGLADSRLGTSDYYLTCTTCGLNTNDCPGHFGHIELSEPVYHISFLNHLILVLKSICLKCSKILYEYDGEFLKNINPYNYKKNFKAIRELTKNINFCYCCGSPVPKVKKEIKENSASIKIIIEKEVGVSYIDEMTGQTKENKKVIKESISPREAYNILRNLSDTDCILLGFNNKISKPYDLVMLRFPVPPMCIRPTAKIDLFVAAKMEDATTLKIADIVTSNIRVRNQMNKDKSSAIIHNLDTHILLQYHCAVYIDNESTSLPKSEFKTGGKPVKSMKERIQGKGGRVRNNCMGKRVDFSARSVITSDPYLDIDEVGVPLRIAVDMTIPEEVTELNIEDMKRLVKNGRSVYPGANFVFKNNNGNLQKIDLQYRKKELRLNVGDVVERHIVDGDYVLFNRQPTLHKPSMMGHRIHVLRRDDCNTFRMNVSVCKPYGADFDGDEMNIHVGQSTIARNELRAIANVKNQIISAKNSNPIIGCTQDALSGAYLLTTSDYKLNYYDFCNIISTTSYVNNFINGKFKVSKKDKIDGRECFSYIIPSKINSEKSKDGKLIFKIKNGILEKGDLNKSLLSTTKNSIIHFISDKYNPNKTQSFIDDTQRLILNYLQLKGLSIGIKDTFINKEIKKDIVKMIKNKILSVNYQITEAENDLSNNLDTILEDTISMELNSLSSNAGKIIMDSLDNNNAYALLIKSGSKGSPLNMGQIAGCVGQMTIDGKRIQKKVNGRSLVLFHRDDDTPEARGFVKNNYVTGLNGYEFFFHTMGGREGLIDTAIKTAETGYIQRRLIKGLEAILINYDGTVRISNGAILQFTYGENGINQVKQKENKINLINYTNKEVEEKLGFSKTELTKLKKFKKVDDFNKKFVKEMRVFRKELIKIVFRSTLNYKIMDNDFFLPVNLYRLAQDYSNNKARIELEPEYILKSFDDLLNDIDYRLLPYLKKNNMFKEDENNFKMIFKIALYEYFCPKKCIFEYGLSKDEFNSLMENIKLNYLKSLVEPGEMVGIIAAQSIGEPTSQMTLNTKHFAGVASKGTATMGVPRINEILSYSKNIKSPQMLVYFDKNINKDKNETKIISSYFKNLNINELVDTVEVYYDTNGTDEKSLILKNDNTSNPFYIKNDFIDIKFLPIVFRLTLNLEKMMDKETTLLDIKTKFISYWYKNFTNIKNLKRHDKDIIKNIVNLAILSNNKNIIHIRFVSQIFNYNFLMNFKDIILNTVTLKGIENIKNVNLISERYLELDKDYNVNVEKENVVITDGINFLDLLKIKGIDFSRTKCNSVYKTYLMYGIEAARHITLHELIFTFNASGSNINHTHLSILVDFMTFNGDVVSIDRHGLSKVDTDPITRASFEKTVDNFINAALFNEVDNLESVSSRICMGQVIHGGTGYFDLELDLDKIEEYKIKELRKNLNINFEDDNLFKDIIESSSGFDDIFIPS
jgi:DNA-directed RNA polymerase II subunit RPB1